MTVIRFVLLIIFGVVALDAFARAQAPLTPLEALTYENTVLRSQVADLLAEQARLKADLGGCYGKLGPIEAAQNRTALATDIATMKADFERPRPGFTFDPATKTFTKAPEPAAPEKPEKE